MRHLPVVFIIVLALTGLSQGEEQKPETSTVGRYFERLDTNGDGKVTLDEAPEQGKMLVEFLLNQSGKNRSDHLDRAEFMRLAFRHTEARPKESVVASALGIGEIQPAPENCPACAKGLTAEFVFKRLDVDEDKLITVTEFMLSPGM